MTTPIPASVDATVALLESGHYVADRGVATALFLALKLGRPLLLEGEAGVGKTEIAKVIASTLGRKLIRLQCYEGLDISTAVYEWNYAQQMLEVRLAEAAGERDRAAIEKSVFSERFLVKRPILQAIEGDPAGAPVLLIDEIDRTDEPFEAFLLEVLSDFQVTIPELGTRTATTRPIVILTSNRTREIHDALKRRCFYHWIDYPSAARGGWPARARVPEADEALTNQVVDFVQRLRTRDLFKSPGVAESIDWVQALVALDQVVLSPDAIDPTLGIVLKYQDDIEKVRGGEVTAILQEMSADAAT
jgi:MoxR-like ATPase